MNSRTRKRSRLFWPYAHHISLWQPHHNMPFAPPPWWHSGLPLAYEKNMVTEYIETLKEQLELAEEYLQELEKEEKEQKKEKKGGKK